MAGSFEESNEISKSVKWKNLNLGVIILLCFKSNIFIYSD
jgi:hypothetical protein